MKSLGLVCSIILLATLPAIGQISIGEKSEINGKVFTDYYWFAQNNNQEIEGDHGFRFRRIYFTYNQEISESFSTRLRLEMSSDGIFEDAPQKMEPVVKDAYLKWKGDKIQVYAGISGTPTWANVEDVWGYRSLEKSPLDLFGLGSSRDFGISVKGQLDEEGKANYQLMFGNGQSNRANEINEGKKWMGSFSYALSEALMVEVYADYNDRTGENDHMTLQGFGAYQTDKFSAGALFAYQHRENDIIGIPGADNNQSYQVFSIFSHFDLNDEVRGVARLDHAFEGVPGTDDNSYLPINSSAPATVFLAGVDFTLHSNVHLMPNIETVIYGEDEQGNTPDSDLIPRLTLSYSF